MPRRNRLKIAIQKAGRIADESRRLLEATGLHFLPSRDRLFWRGENLPVDILLVRDDDIPRLIADAVVDLGIVGRNVLEETALTATDPLPVVPLLSLGFGRCRLALAFPEESSYDGPRSLEGLRIATSYPGLLGRYLTDAGIEATVVPLAGSVEVAPALGTAEAICDLVSTGATLRANRLREVAVVLRSEALLVGRPQGETPTRLVSQLLRRMQGVLAVRESKYVMLHAPRENLGVIRDLLPGAERPTVIPLDGEDDRVAVHALCRENVFWETLEELEAAGATAVLVLPVEKMLATGATPEMEAPTTRSGRWIEPATAGASGVSGGANPIERTRRESR